ncbi:MAG TPA: putative toxin-antitoxin system toxin component, PIN family, partial [Flavobacteriales bacterium]|nr:putative toxin-antitoxin system toxin component, PIN family [Flavobacteriales bacterium]
LSRPRIRNRVPERIANTFITALRRNATRVETTSIVDVCRDKKDNFLLALAQDGLADLLITGDENLLVVERFGGTIILSPSEFTSAFN